MVAIIVSVMTINRRLRLLLSGLSLALMLISLAPVSASSANISRSYKSSDTIPVGSLVSLDSSQSDYVVAANNTNGKLLLGVVVKSDDSLLAVNVSSTTVQVATSGTASVLVSNLNGDIKVGDLPLSGLTTDKLKDIGVPHREHCHRSGSSPPALPYHPKCRVINFDK